MNPRNPSTEVPFVDETGAAATAAGSTATGGADLLQEQEIPGFAFADPARVARYTQVVDQQARGLEPTVRAAPGPAGAADFELVLDKSDLLPVSFLDVGVQRAHAVCKIKASGTNYRGESGEWAGTGFLVSNNILLTNHHVLNSPDVARNASAIFNYQVGPDGTLLQTTGCPLNPDRLFLTDPADGGLDFTFVWVENEPGKAFGYVPLDRRSLNISQNDVANIVQHPSGDPKMVVLQQNTIESIGTTVVRYTSDTMPGSSGSPVFNNAWSPVALHHASRNADPTEARDGYRYLNEGIKFSAIAALLEKLSEDAQHQYVGKQLLSLFSGADPTLLNFMKETDPAMGFFGTLGRGAPGTSSPSGQPRSGVEVVVDAYTGEANDVDVGFWNVEWFSRRYAEKLDAVAQVIISMNLDIWALEETSPQATAALVDHLNHRYGQQFQYAASEPDAREDLQTTAVMWNSKTVAGERLQWPAEIDQWFHVDSRQFSQLGLEAVDGPVFPRYPGLFHFSAQNREPASPFDFYVVPLHLKAMAEGEKRRRMAGQVIAAAISKMIAEHDGDRDWIVGGDFNASLASQDFAQLIGGGLVPLSAQDEQGGAFSYLKRPRSLIDHIFLSANLATTFGAGDYLIVAEDKAIPRYIETVSDHRPVLVRLSLDSQQSRGGEPEAHADLPASLRAALAPIYG